MEKTGGCLCGAVRFVARDVPGTFGICHCPMCRRWTGAALVEVSVKTENITWDGSENIAVRAGSDWAERAWCRECGTGLYFRQTKPGKWFGATDLPLGLFDDPNGFELSHEIYVDHAPDGFEIVDRGQKRMTRDDVIALNPDLDAAP
ncbi:GFA family protein [uncultured Tateyamaria sp.]|uniref:GFA family protein n=1 Tax=Tateyamaria sp. 1078 TaxID=3417464 RepID=UPI00261A113A|nr:GFA family protein [uncultured Tateyamaria sp.]